MPEVVEMVNHVHMQNKKIVANIHYYITHPYNVLILKILVTHDQLSGKSRIAIDKPKLIRPARSSISSSVC